MLNSISESTAHDCWYVMTVCVRISCHHSCAAMTDNSYKFYYHCFSILGKFVKKSMSFMLKLIQFLIVIYIIFLLIFKSQD